MHMEEDDANNLKTWVVVRLKDISDADSDVLADYVLALIRTDTPDSKLRLDVLESLEDFLKESARCKFLCPIFSFQETRLAKMHSSPPVQTQQISSKRFSKP